jgi:hypothetical protein
MAAWTSLVASSQDSNEPPIFDIGAVVNAAPESLLGVEVVAANVEVREIVDDGFWVTPIGSDESVFTVPAEGNLITVRAGEVISVHGEIRLMRRPEDRPVIPSRTFRSFIPYVYAYTVRPAWPKESMHATIRLLPALHPIRLNHGDGAIVQLLRSRPKSIPAS